MATGTPAGDGLTGADVVFTPGRGYRAPVVRRAAVSLTVAGLLALLAGLGVLTVVTGPVAAASRWPRWPRPCCTSARAGSAPG